jgi:hypothetical protein
MDTLRSVAHLQREIGDGLFNMLVSSHNTDAVREFAKTLVIWDDLSVTFTVGNRTYDMLSFFREDDGKAVVGHTMVERVKKMKANLGKDDGQYLLNNQRDIPVALRGEVVFVFTGWRGPIIGFVCVILAGTRLPGAGSGAGAHSTITGLTTVGFSVPSRYLSPWVFGTGSRFLGSLALALCHKKTPHANCFRANNVRGSSFLCYNTRGK